MAVEWLKLHEPTVWVEILGCVVADVKRIESKGQRGQNVPLEVIVSCAKVLNIYPGMTPKAVAERSEYSEREIAEGLMEMATRGWVLVDQIGQSFKHTLTPIGRKETLDV